MSRGLKELQRARRVPFHAVAPRFVTIQNMQKVMKRGWVVLLAGLLATAGCGREESAPPPKELAIEEMNDALAYIEESGLDYPSSVYELTNLPQLHGKVFPVLPDGQYFSIDRDHNRVIIEMDHLPDLPKFALPDSNSY